MATMPPLTRLYPARVIRLIDGDTSAFAMSLGFGVETAGNDGKGVRCRYAGLNAPELKTDAGKVAASFVEKWLGDAATASQGAYYPLLIESHLLDNYGRPLVTIWRRDTGACLNDDLLSSGNAVVMAMALQVSSGE